MKVKSLFIVVCVALAIVGCSRADPEVKEIQEKLIGVWELDSTTTVRAGLQKSKKTTTIAFSEDQKFIYYWWDSDLVGKYEGRYFVLKNPDRGLVTITLIPDVDTLKEGVYRRPYLNFDVEDIREGKMVTLHETERIERYDMPDKIWFTERRIYKSSAD
ncbi:hypothetical protein [Pontibacter burrus]|uniref:Lipocalin-like domain-containing protein n=1 Tax=Pontibacter burrus TaxID=2704466 RepID=A0A6B3LX07_9BACT|nr:hypothetical protein [Pontibacter burrus]NEM97964.1 hypothetical protein [Pontibacter burrus]